MPAHVKPQDRQLEECGRFILPEGGVVKIGCKCCTQMSGNNDKGCDSAEALAESASDAEAPWGEGGKSTREHTSIQLSSLVLGGTIMKAKGRTGYNVKE